LTLQHDVLESGNATFYVNARAEVEIGIGYPALFPPYEKKLFVRMPVRGYTDVLQETSIIVTGLKWISDSFSVAFPEYMPLMVLHDPPGDSSSTSYSDQHTVVTATGHHLAFSESLSISGSAEVGADTTVTLCNGVSVGFIVEATLALCSTTVEFKIAPSISASASFSADQSFSTSTSSSIGFSWDYSTSGSPWLYYHPLYSNGESNGIVDQQTMYLIPALNIVYSLSLHVRFDRDLCKAVGKPVTTWFLKSPRNFQVVSWKSRYDILGTLIPALQSLLDEQLALPRSADVNDRVRQLTTTIAQWNKVIQRVEDLHASADRGEIQSNSATLTHVTGFDSSKITSSLVAEDLLKDLNGNSIVKNLDGSIAGDVSGIEALSAFSFVGGGASLGFSVGVEKDTGSQKSISFGVGAEAGFSLSVGINAFGADFSFGLGYSASFAAGFGDDVSESRAQGSGRSFTLADNDDGDQFDVKVG